jgi:hypothetical protein
MEGFSFSMALDVNTGYNHIEFDSDAQKLCKIVLPWESINTNAYPRASILPRCSSKCNIKIDPRYRKCQNAS